MAFGTKHPIVMAVNNAQTQNIALLTASGQLQDSGNKIENFALAPLAKDLSLYVNTTTGNDNNDGTAPEHAKKTIQAAINSIPQNLGRYCVTIFLAAGTYVGDIAIGHFYGGGGYKPGILITCMEGEVATIQGRIFLYGTSCYSKISNLFIDGRVEACGCSGVIEMENMQLNVAEADYGCGIRALRSVAVKIYSCTVNNAAVAAVSSDASTVYIYNLSGSENAVAISAGDSAQGGNALVVIGNSGITGSVKYQKVFGGAIIEEGVLV